MTSASYWARRQSEAEVMSGAVMGELAPFEMPRVVVDPNLPPDIVVVGDFTEFERPACPRCGRRAEVDWIYVGVGVDTDRWMPGMLRCPTDGSPGGAIDRERRT